MAPSCTFFTSKITAAAATSEVTSNQKMLNWVNRMMQKLKRGSIFVEKSTAVNGSHLSADNFKTISHPQRESMTSTASSPILRSSPEKVSVFHAVSLVEEDLKVLQKGIVMMLEHTELPLLKVVARYYVDLGGKRLRPAIILLLSRALENHKSSSSYVGVSSDSSRSNKLSNAIGENHFSIHQNSCSPLPKQQKLAEIIEMIHTASIAHDDVLDDAISRRGESSINIRFGNKLAILSGDYLLSRASVSLSTLENHEVTRRISEVISDLVQGELMQTIQASNSSSSPSFSSLSSSMLSVKSSSALNSASSNITNTFDHYLKKTYYKTASLISNGCRSAAILGDHSDELVEMAAEYGKNLGLAFQLIDDLLDLTGSSSNLGKATSVDLVQGLATAPILFAREQFPQLSALIERKFSCEGDVELALSLLGQSDGLLRTRQLAASYCDSAVEVLSPLRPSPAKDGLIELAQYVLHRNR